MDEYGVCLKMGNQAKLLFWDISVGKWWLTILFSDNFWTKPCPQFNCWHCILAQSSTGTLSLRWKIDQMWSEMGGVAGLSDLGQPMARKSRRGKNLFCSNHGKKSPSSLVTTPPFFGVQIELQWTSLANDWTMFKGWTIWLWENFNLGTQAHTIPLRNCWAWEWTRCLASVRFDLWELVDTVYSL